MKSEIILKKQVERFWKIYHSIDPIGKTNYEVFLQALDRLIDEGVIDKTQKYDLWQAFHFKQRNRFRKQFEADGLFVKGYFRKKKKKKKKIKSSLSLN